MIKKKWPYYSGLSYWFITCPVVHVLGLLLGPLTCSEQEKNFSCLWIITVFTECVSTNKSSLIHVPPLSQCDHIYFLCELLGEHIWGSGVNNVTICCCLLCCVSDVLVKKCLKRLCRDENYYPKIFSKWAGGQNNHPNWNTIRTFLQSQRARQTSHSEIGAHIFT